MPNNEEGNLIAYEIFFIDYLKKNYYLKEFLSVNLITMPKYKQLLYISFWLRS